MKIIIKITFIIMLAVIVLKPGNFVASQSSYAEIQMLNSLNFYANQYTIQEKEKPQKFSDFVEFDPLSISPEKSLNIYSYYNYFDKEKHIKGQNSYELEIYFKRKLSSIKVCYVLVDGKVYINNNTTIAESI